MLNFTGNGSAYTPELGSNSAYLEFENKLTIFDCGESVFARMKELDLNFQGYNEIIFLITHTHSDHIGSLAGFVSYLKNVKNVLPTIIHPEETVQKILALAGISLDNYLLIETTDIQMDDDLHVRFLPVRHVNSMTCYGLLLTCGEHTFYYSGDAANVPDEVVQQMNNGKLDAVYQDVTIFPDNRSHLYYKKLFELFTPEALEHVYPMHLETGAETVLKKVGLQPAEVSESN